MTKLSILICSLQKREAMYCVLMTELIQQAIKINTNLVDTDFSISEGCRVQRMVIGEVEIISATDNQRISTGRKRNLLLSKSTGKYVCYADDDDTLPEYYIEEMIKATESDCDAIGISGYMTTNNQNPIKWYISKDHKYCRSTDENGNEIFLRYNNHLSPIKSEIVKQFQFPDKQFGEDYEMATMIHNSGLIKTEYKIERYPMYIYNFQTNKP